VLIDLSALSAYVATAKDGDPLHGFRVAVIEDAITAAMGVPPVEAIDDAIASVSGLGDVAEAAVARLQDLRCRAVCAQDLRACVVEAP
jgi:hypothetical protein